MESQKASNFMPSFLIMENISLTNAITSILLICRGTNGVSIVSTRTKNTQY